MQIVTHKMDSVVNNPQAIIAKSVSVKKIVEEIPPIKQLIAGKMLIHLVLLLEHVLMIQKLMHVSHVV
jgi:hypothetical protein